MELKLYDVATATAELAKPPTSTFGIGNNLDNIFKLAKGYFGILQSPPCQGKTTFLNYYGVKLSKLHNWHVLYIMMETPDRLELKFLTKYFEGNVEETLKNNHLLKMELKTFDEIIEAITQVAAKFDNLLVIVDNATLIEALMGTDVTDLIRKQYLLKLSKLTKDLGISIILCAHSIRLKEGQRPSINTSYGGTFMESTCDFMLSIEITDEENNISTFRVLKRRYEFFGGNNGGDEISLQFDRKTREFINVDNDDNDEVLNEIFGKIN